MFSCIPPANVWSFFVIGATVLSACCYAKQVSSHRIISDCPSGCREVGLEAKQLLHEDVNTPIYLLDKTGAALPKQWDSALQASFKKKGQQISGAVCRIEPWYEIKVQKHY